MQRERYDLILMDIQMPVMDGYTATQTLRASGVAVPIIAITANGTEDDKQRCRDAGFTAYVTKPVSMAALLRAVGEQLGLSPEPTSLSVRTVSTSPEMGIESAAALDFLASGRKERTVRSEITLPVDPVFRDFAMRFIRKVSDSLPQLMSSIDAKDGTTLSGLAHWMKGTGGTVGLPVLTDIGRELQVMAKAEDYSRARLIVLELQAIITKLRCVSECELTV